MAIRAINKGEMRIMKNQTEIMERLEFAARVIAGLEKNDPENTREIMIQYAVARAYVWTLEADEMVMWNAIESFR